MTQRLHKKPHSYIHIHGISVIFILLIITIPISAWDNCPFGKINEPFPGTCGRYTDIDGDSICDLSQPPPISRENTQEQDGDNQEIDISNNGSLSDNTNARLNYYFLPIALILFVVYILTYLLVKKKKMKLNHLRKIWNVLLLGTFLISGLFGILLAIIISYRIRLSFYTNLLFWHVEFGIAMAMISFFHIAWHWKYYLRLVKGDNNKK